MINQETKEEIKKQTTGYMMAAFGLVAGLAWNDAIKSLIEAFYPFAKNGLFAKFFYAILITLMVVLVGRSVLKTSPAEPKIK